MGARVLVQVTSLVWTVSVTALGCASTSSASPPPRAGAPTSTSTSTSIAAPAAAATSHEGAETASAPVLVGSGEKRGWRVAVMAVPEIPAFPAGLFRAASKLCLEETKATFADEVTLPLTLTTQGGRITSVARETGTPDLLVSCFQRLYAKIKVANAPPRFGLSVTITPVED